MPGECGRRWTGSLRKPLNSRLWNRCLREIILFFHALLTDLEAFGYRVAALLTGSRLTSHTLFGSLITRQLGISSTNAFFMTSGATIFIAVASQLTDCLPIHMRG
jgi:hypothetical protein